MQIFEPSQVGTVSRTVLSGWEHSSDLSPWAWTTGFQLSFQHWGFQIKRNLGLYHKSLPSLTALLKVFAANCMMVSLIFIQAPLSLSGFWLSFSPRLQGRQCHPQWPVCDLMAWLCFVPSWPCPLNTCVMFVGGSWLYFTFPSFSSSLSQEWLTLSQLSLDSFLQTGTTNSPVREQSERKMKNNIRKEPFGKLNKKCYIKINTRAWPFVVLYILKPPIDSLLITCLFYFTDTSLERL